jgi:hypothetical protein
LTVAPCHFIKFHVTEVLISKRHMGPLNDTGLRSTARPPIGRLIDLAAGHEAHGFALNYFPLPMGGRAVDRSPVSFNASHPHG